MYGDRAESEMERVKKILHELLKEYEAKSRNLQPSDLYSSITESSSSSSTCSSSKAWPHCWFKDEDVEADADGVVYESELSMA
ncbi:hypothetical protein Tsubulata_051236 [Turnera subulata]|uniref:Uncharacterized protein n=1 Tax=Turnera subulata TaxID=218843 RepID=A0A9Q0JFG4_9ROSI|nr:hypothetical protein Tsubulata_051236 [Turnera subulata]